MGGSRNIQQTSTIKGGWGVGGGGFKPNKLNSPSWEAVWPGGIRRWCCNAEDRCSRPPCFINSQLVYLLSIGIFHYVMLI